MKRFLFLLIALALVAPADSHAQLGKLKKKARKALNGGDRSSRSAMPDAPKPREIKYEVEYEGTPEERQEAIEMARALYAAYKAHYEAFRPDGLRDFNYSYLGHGWPAEGETWMAAVADVESRYDALYAALRPLAERFGASYADVGNAYRKLAIDDYKDVGIASDDGTTSGMFKRLYDGMEAVALFRKHVAAGAVLDAAQTMKLLDDRFFIPETRMEKARALKDELTLAHWFDPHNEDLNAMLARIDTYIDEVAEGVQAEIDAGQWPGASGETQHTRAVLDFFRSHPQWGGGEEEVLAVAVAGNWVVTEKDLLGRPIQWGLPVYVAVTKPTWREMDAARVFDLTVLARQGSPAPQAPPFTGFWVGDSYLMRLGKVPTQ